jgi:hypothetical protein
MPSSVILSRFFAKNFHGAVHYVAGETEMRSAIQLTLLLGCGALSMAATVPSEPIEGTLGCLALPAEDVSLKVCAAIELGNFGALSETLRSLTYDTEAAAPPDPPVTMAELDRMPLFTDVTADKPWLRGPEPPAALLAASGFVCLALLNWRRRISRTIQRSKRRLYTTRGLA